MTLALRRRALRLGYLAEHLALLSLMLKGYRLVAWRYAAAGGEIDLIVRRGDVVAFVEVKARADLERARAAIDGTKRRRFSGAARAWLARNAWAGGMILRADAVLVTPRRWPVHVPGAFEMRGF